MIKETYLTIRGKGRKKAQTTSEKKGFSGRLVGNEKSVRTSGAVKETRKGLLVSTKRKKIPLCPTNGGGKKKEFQERREKGEDV